MKPVPFAACRGIVFDLDDTLYDRHSALVRLFESWWGPLSADQWREIDARDARGHSVRLEFFAFLKSRYPVPDSSAEALFARYRQEFPRHMRAAETPAVLARLAQTPWVQAILTNGSSEFQRAKYHALDLADYIGVERLLISGEIGRDKPDPYVFQYTCEALGIAPQELLFVGDHPEKDIAGARAAGFATCWLQKSPHEHAEADATIQSLPELLPLLGLD